MSGLAAGRGAGIEHVFTCCGREDLGCELCRFVLYRYIAIGEMG